MLVAVSVLEREATITTLAQSGMKVRNWWSVRAELQADWRIDEAKHWKDGSSREIRVIS